MNTRVVAGVAISVLLYAVALPTMLAPALGPQRGSAAVAIGTVASAVLFTEGGLLLLLRWRLTGDARACLVGVGALLYGIFVIPLTEGVELFSGGPGAPAAQCLAQSLAGLAAIGFFLRAATTDPVDARLRPGLLIARAGVVLVAAFFLLVAVPGAPLVERPPALAAIGGAMGALWLVAGVALLRNDSFPRSGSGSWLGGPLLVLALATFASSGSPFMRVPFSLDAAALGMAAGLLMVAVAGYELLVVLADQGEGMFRLKSMLGGLERARAAQEERAHDARSAVMAVRAAISALTRYRERLDDSSRTNLEVALDAELGRLVELIDLPAHAAQRQEFDVAKPISTVATTARSQGSSVVLSLSADGARAVGSPADLARVLQTLLDNARLYASGSPVTIRTAHDRDTVRIYVEDRGPGVPAEERDLVFARGRRGAAATGVPGSGLGLFTAARLMRTQGGSLELRDRAGGGASFVVTLAAVGTRIAHGDAGDVRAANG